MSKARRYYPLLLALYPSIFLYAANIDQIRPGDVVLPLGASLVSSIIVFAVFQRVFRNIDKAALYTLLLVVLFAAYGHLLAVVFSLLLEPWLKFDQGLIEFHKLEQTIGLALLAIDIVLAAAGFYYLRVRVGDSIFGVSLARINEFFAIVSLLLFVQPVIKAAFSFAGSSPSVQGSTAQDTVAGSNVQGSELLGYAPDIYYIVLDGYARADVLKEHYGFDNQQFLDSLKQKGFFVAEKSRGNYTYTDLSLASTLNLQHLAFLEEELGRTATRRDVTFRMVRDNKVRRFLASRGYRYIHFQSTTSITADNVNADEVIRCDGGVFGSEFSRVFAESTMLRFWMSSNTTADLARCHLSQLEKLGQVAARPYAKFVFAHFIPPHHPYLFDRQGNIRQQTTIANQFRIRESLWQDKQAYTDQLYFFSKKIDELLSKILEKSLRPPIIILKSDHGPKLFYYRPNEPKEKRALYSHVRLATLAAYYLPEPKVLIPESINNVNDFVYILNHYFGAQYELQPNTQYYSFYYAPFDFSEVELPP